MKSKHIILMSIVLLGLVGLMGYGYMVQQDPKAFLAFAVGSQPDDWDNRIHEVTIYQNRAGSLWSTTFYHEDYESGMTKDILANYPTWIVVGVNLNAILSPGGPEEAKTLTRVYLSISGVKTNELMTAYYAYANYDHLGFYTVMFNSTSWTPATSVLYTVTLNYQAYY